LRPSRRQREQPDVLLLGFSDPVLAIANGQVAFLTCLLLSVERPTRVGA
jgi:hypothetical protein